MVRLAEALDRLECRSQVEVTFVLDGCTDNTRQALESVDHRHRVNIIETPGAGAAAARNRGAEASSGDILLFMDDDVMPQPGLLDAHLQAQESRERLIAVGPYPYAPEMPVNPLDFMIRDWWHKRFTEMANPGHRFTYEDCVTGNISLPRRDFEAVGGFDECFEKDGREDYELGARLLKSGMAMDHASRALAYHYPTNTPRSSLRKWYTFGRADIRFAEKHPDLFHSLPLARWWRISPVCCGMSRLVIPVCGRPQAAIRVLGSFFERNLDRLLSPGYRQLWECVRNAVYFLGAVSACGGMGRFEDLLRESMELDNRARRRIVVEDVDVFSGLCTVHPKPEHDTLFLLPRVGRPPAKWVEASPQDELHPEILARHLSLSCGHEMWQQARQGSPAERCSIWEVIPRAKGLPSSRNASTRRRIGPAPEHRLSISVVVLSEQEVCPSRELSGHHIIRIASDAGILRSCLMRALEERRSDLVAFLSPSDRPDPGWMDAVRACFARSDIGCVLTPAILRSVCSRADELYHQLASFGRVRSWEHTCLSDWMRPADILSGFPVCCHRPVFRRDALISALKSLPYRSSDEMELITRALVAMFYLYQGVVYEPRAIIWREPVRSVQEVLRMGIEHSRMIRRAAAERLSLRGRSRIKALRMVAGLLRTDPPAFGAAGDDPPDWPFLAGIAGVAAGMRGFWQGFTVRNRDDGSKSAEG